MSSSITGPEVDPNHEDTLRTVAEALGRIDYGSVLITIHQGVVVGIETSTKVRPATAAKEHTS